MILQVHIPAPPLGDYVSALIYYDGFDPIHQMDRFLPDGNTTSLWGATAGFLAGFGWCTLIFAVIALFE